MLSAAEHDAASLERVRAELSGLALRGYSGELEFQMAPEHHIITRKSEVQVGGDLAEQSEILKSIADHWESIELWMERPSRFLLVSLQRGKITRVLISDASHIK